jgi:hypothetical protein
MTVFCWREGESIRCSENAPPARFAGDARQFDLGVPPGTFHELEFFKRFNRSFGIISKDYEQLIRDGDIPNPVDDGSPIDEATFRHWNEPRVIRHRYVPLVADMDADGPTFTNPPILQRNGTHTRVIQRGTAEGHEVLLPPELDVEHTYGHKGNSGVNEGAACPDLVSNASLTLWGDEIEGGTTKGVRIACGVVVPGALNPGDGWFIERSGTGGKMRIGFTDDDGEPISTGDLEVQGTLTLAIAGGGGYTLPNTDGTSGQVLKTDGAGNVTWQDP